jgi:hypothetical protein
MVVVEYNTTVDPEAVRRYVENCLEDELDDYSPGHRAPVQSVSVSLMEG